TNGTYVDGYRIREARLEHGQEIRLGDAIVKFIAAEAAEYARYRVDGSLEPGAARLGAKPSGLIGGYQIDRIARQIELVARETPNAQSPLSVLILGESGTGKEVVAQAIHDQSGRRGAFRAVNCAALPKDLVESELF